MEQTCTKKFIKQRNGPGGSQMQTLRQKNAPKTCTLSAESRLRSVGTITILQIVRQIHVPLSNKSDMAPAHRGQQRGANTSDPNWNPLVHYARTCTPNSVGVTPDAAIVSASASQTRAVVQQDASQIAQGASPRRHSVVVLDLLCVTHASIRCLTRTRTWIGVLHAAKL